MSEHGEPIVKAPTRGAFFTASGDLNEYLDMANRVTEAMREGYPDLIKVVEGLSRTWHNDVFGGELTIDPFSAIPFMQSNFLWCASVRTALSGHPMAVFPILRASLEAASYAYLMNRSEKMRDAWAFRDRSEEDRKAARRLFTPAVSDTAKALGTSERGFGVHLKALYEDAITFGAHPNPKFAFQHWAHTGESDDYHLFNNTVIAGPESPNTLYGLMATIEIGFAASFLCALTVPDHPNLERVRWALSDLWEQMNKFLEVAQEQPAVSPY